MAPPPAAGSVRVSLRGHGMHGKWEIFAKSRRVFTGNARPCDLDTQDT